MLRRAIVYASAPMSASRRRLRRSPAPDTETKMLTVSSDFATSWWLEQDPEWEDLACCFKVGDNKEEKEEFL